MQYRKLTMICCAAVLSLGLAACGGGSDSPPAASNGDTMQPDPAKLAMAADATLMTAKTAVDALTDSSDDAAVSAANNAVAAAKAAVDAAADADNHEALSARLVTLESDLASAVKSRMMAMDETGTEKAIGLSKALAAVAVDDDLAPTVSRASGGVTFKSTGYEAGAAPMSIAGWAGGTLTQKTMTVVAYSDIDAETRKAFTKVYGATATANPGGLTFSSGKVELGTGSGIKGRLDKARFPQPKSAGGGETTWTYGAEDDDELPREFSGTFQGARGDYACSGTTCSVKVTDSAAGGIYTLTGDWTFTPDSAATAIVADADYLTFGWWIDEKKKTTAGDYPFEVKTFATGKATFPTGSVAPLVGTVKYSGAAAGLYAVKTVSDGEIASARHGAFTADASLTADFGADNAEGFLSGKIDNFRGGMDMADWEVTLEKSLLATGTALADLDETDNPTGKMASGKIGDTESTGGGWDASLHGTGEKGAAPSGIAGTFNVNFTNADIAGAFGAKRNE